MKTAFLAKAAHGLMCAIVALYAACILVLSIGHTIPLAALLAAAAIIFALLLLGSRRFGAWGLSVSAEPDRLSPRVFWASAGLCALCLCVYLAGFYPGGFSSDTVIQWIQIEAFEFDNHHPALHTLMLYALTRICDHPVFVLGAQLLCYALAVGYMAAVLRRWRFPRPLWLLSVAYLCLSPAICNMMSFLWKDCAFAICALFLAAQILEIHCSRGAWLSRPPHIAALGLTLCLASILRHNGPALTLPAAVWLLISFPGQFKRLGASLLTAVLLFAAVKGPLYSAFDVAPTAGSTSETFGLPMVVLTHVYAEAPQSLDEETVAYLNRIADWQTYYDHDAVGDWNEIKWYLGDYDISEYTLLQIFGFALRAARAEPQLALEALAGLWQMPLLPFGDSYWRMSPYVDPHFYDYHQTGIPIVHRVLNALCRYSAEPAVSWLFWNPGFFLLLVMLACALFALHRPLSALTLPAMLICYDLVTSLVLSSPTDFRFYISTPMLFPLCLAVLLARAGGKEAP